MNILDALDFEIECSHIECGLIFTLRKKIGNKQLSCASAISLLQLISETSAAISINQTLKSMQEKMVIAIDKMVSSL